MVGRASCVKRLTTVGADAPPEVVMNRQEVLQELKRYYCAELAEDKQDGTNFDCAVLDAIDKVAAQQLRAADLPYRCSACGHDRAEFDPCPNCCAT